ncbi:cation diffusion facilitator family transporter [Aliiglaciecola sp. CAU 1673]|uniref:cation diffusion facilitator family transporter n=1 Tax=Aliiglaciecola sp. CAU 1673 TaxID=3032595 RepID=UPI0023DB7D12|nr:cation diffusion facilitator family transporter [Aliiglaciecola sp. CAU 1673]MDF2177385.1 cation diffusion facilitator family transporter [Aliiglaciecola sp. CAU 1673]
MADCCATNAQDNEQRRLLWTVLILNAAMFVVEFVAGWYAQSAGLLADSLDMLADALVYGVSLYAVGKSLKHKASAALLNGTLQLLLAVLVLVDVGKKILLGAQPDTTLMYSVAFAALAVNILCFALLYRHRRGDINLRASWICSRNDMLANTGVIGSAALVTWIGAAWPDWLIGALIAMVILLSALRIIREAKASLSNGQPVSDCCPH